MNRILKLKRICFKNSILLISITLSLSLIFLSSKYSYYIIYDDISCSLGHKFNAVEIHPTNKWVFNPKIAHYSPKIILYNSETLILEALAICDYDNQTADEIKSNAQFIVHFALSEPSSVCLGISEADEIPTSLLSRDNQTARSFWRLRAFMDRSQHKFRFNDLLFAIVDIGQSKLLFSEYESDEDEKRLLIGFHKPIFYEANNELAKKHQVAHCVHMVRNIESEERIELVLTWLEIQKKLNYGKIRLYLNEVSEKTAVMLRKFSEIINLDLELVDYKFDFEFLCEHYIKLSNESEVRQLLLNNCRMFTQAFFDREKETCINSHELACTNDCYTNLRYDYDYITNFDFDEFLFPRKAKTNDYRMHSTTNCLLNQTDYDIYEYVSQLSKDYGPDSASFHFEHVVYLDKMDDTFIDNILKYEKGNYNQTNDLEHKQIGKESFIYDPDRYILTDFTIHSTDLDLIEYIREGQDVVDCLNETIQARRKINPSWNRVYGIHVNNRLGKSVFVSNLTELCDQHKPILVAENSQEINVEMSIGFSSHFREEIGGFINDFLQFPLNMFYFDLELYQFFATF